MNKKILHLAVPAIVSNITVPLLGLIDVAIVGHLGSAAYIGAIAVGGLLFNIIYWLFGFLRMGTSGFTSQAFGKGDMQEVSYALVRALSVGMVISLCLLLLQIPIERIAFRLIDAGEEVKQFASIYFRICIWGAPAVLGLYGLSGWFIGMQNARHPMLVAITQNIVNILVSLLLVFGLKMKVEGVAIGTLVAQYSGFLMALFIQRRFYRHTRTAIRWKEVMNKSEIRRFFSINRDIFLRTLCLVAVTTFFTTTGARQGDVILAVNTLLMQLFTLFSYFMDGFAYAGEALTGLFVGGKNSDQLRLMIRNLFRWGILLSLSATLLYAFGGRTFLSLLTNETAVIEEAMHYFYWVLAIPLAGFAAFLWDGILIGATASRLMLVAMLVAAGNFFLLFYLFYPTLGNHALWLAFIVYLLLRGVMMTVMWNRSGIAASSGR